MLFVCYPKCSTCGKARDWLNARGLEFTERDIKAENPTADELREWHAKSGLPWKRFFNTSGQLYRAMGMLVKRPILVTDGTVLVGFREKEWAAALS